MTMAESWENNRWEYDARAGPQRIEALSLRIKLTLFPRLRPIKVKQIKEFEVYNSLKSLYLLYNSYHR